MFEPPEKTLSSSTQDTTKLSHPQKLQWPDVLDTIGNDSLSVFDAVTKAQSALISESSLDITAVADVVDVLNDRIFQTKQVKGNTKWEFSPTENQAFQTLFQSLDKFSWREDPFPPEREYIISLKRFFIANPELGGLDVQLIKGLEKVASGNADLDQLFQKRLGEVVPENEAADQINLVKEQSEQLIKQLPEILKTLTSYLGTIIAEDGSQPPKTTSTARTTYGHHMDDGSYANRLDIVPAYNISTWQGMQSQENGKYSTAWMSLLGICQRQPEALKVAFSTNKEIQNNVVRALRIVLSPEEHVVTQVTEYMRSWAWQVSGILILPDFTGVFSESERQELTDLIVNSVSSLTGRGNLAVRSHDQKEILSKMLPQILLDETVPDEVQWQRVKRIGSTTLKFLTSDQLDEIQEIIQAVNKSVAWGKQHQRNESEIAEIERETWEVMLSNVGSRWIAPDTSKLTGRQQEILTDLITRTRNRLVDSRLTNVQRGTLDVLTRHYRYYIVEAQPVVDQMLPVLIGSLKNIPHRDTDPNTDYVREVAKVLAHSVQVWEVFSATTKKDKCFGAVMSLADLS